MGTSPLLGLAITSAVPDNASTAVFDSLNEDLARMIDRKALLAGDEGILEHPVRRSIQRFLIGKSRASFVCSSAGKALVRLRVHAPAKTPVSVAAIDASGAVHVTVTRLT